jgi:hypothetical protein
MDIISDDFSSPVTSGVELEDIWQVTIHVAGQVYMARKFGNQNVTAKIWRTVKGGEDETWKGQFWWVPAKRPVAKHERLIDVAGEAAECVWESIKQNAFFDPLSVLRWEIDMSTIDWPGVGCEPGGALNRKTLVSVKKAMELISNDWPAVLDEAVRLLRLARNDIEEWLDYWIKEQEFKLCSALRDDLSVIHDMLERLV